MKKKIAIIALIAISNLANAQLNENQNEFIKVNKNNLLNDEKRFQENKILVFGNFNYYNKNSRHSKSYKKKGTVNPPLRPIGEYKPLTPEVDPLRPIGEYKPLTPEVDPLRPIDKYEPITPTVPPIYKPEIIIWEDGKDITGTSYTLTHDVTTNTNDGLKTIGGEIINEATITVAGEWKYGMKVENGGNGINNGIINASKGVRAIDGGKIINNGLISLTEPNISKVGMQADTSGVVVNEETGVIEIESNGGIWDSGMKTVDGIAKNKGEIILSGGGSIKDGMFAIGNGTIINEETGIIEINSDDGDSYGMNADDDSTAVNEGKITLNGHGIGMTAGDRGVVTNKGRIILNGDGNTTFGMYATGNGTIINEEKGIIEVLNSGDDGSYGLIAHDDSTAINKGTININSKNGIYDSGMYVDGTGIATNEGTINMNGGSYGMNAKDSGTIINEEKGIIEIKDGIWTYGMSVENGIAINKGKIVFNDGYTGKVGMIAIDSGTVTNENIIEINAMNGVGMRANNTSTAINKGTININGDNGIGIEINSGATGINDDLGVINLNANDGIGIKVDGVGSSYVNNGDINIASGTTGNQKIVLSGGATFSNSGSIVTEGEFNTDKMGNGQFIMSDGGSLEAETIKGDIYASGALAMGGYDDIYSTYKMLKTTNLEGEIISNSAMFNADFTENADENGFYDVVLDRKDFNAIVSNEELGKILEDNYEENGDKFKENYYDALKLVTTEKGLNKAAEDSYGMSYYPTLAKQTFEIINDSNQVIVNNVIDNVKYREVDETIAIAGVNVTRLENDSYNDISGYDTDLYSVYLGAEKQLSKNTRIGGIITIGKSDTESKENEGGPREDYYYQGNLYLTYENDERLKFTSMVFGGITDTALERTLAFGSLNETMTDDINNYYLGINNEVSKKYYFNGNYIKPKFEINFTYMMQDDISESGDQGLEIDGVNSISLETGIGLALGRDFYLENRSKINLEGSVTGYAELGDPYKDLDSTFNTLSTDKVKIDGYNNDDFYGEILMGGSYETEDLLTIYTKVGYRIGNDFEGFVGNIGLNYLF
ncbi:autotransporter domain-containing protein [Psychrilyobacter atlanticus]|uniref:autotransporter domain-containing protein n=1 Tax=Psychrilyobacter atlanticus TaxID=271091 RepID=UPI0003FC0997|nr:autotransporter domain-containing protein [Psychrilyobacter atlanticus]